MLKLSARNQFSGTIREIRHGVANTHVRLQIAPGVVINATITNEAAEEMMLKVGDQAIAVVKAADVILGKED